MTKAQRVVYSGSIDAFFGKAKLKCTICEADEGECDCWEKCSCGWMAEKGMPCENPDTKNCSTKLKYKEG